MGMDVVGKVGEPGERAYFRRNVWGWRPLADYCTSRYPVLTAGCLYWQSNDGDGLDADVARELGELLLDDVKSGVAKEYVRHRDLTIAKMPREICNFCYGTGVRTDEVGVRLGMDDRRWCNACDGMGTCKPTAAHYSLMVEDIQEFGEFLIRSGGFEIW